MWKVFNQTVEGTDITIDLNNRSGDILLIMIGLYTIFHMYYKQKADLV